MVMLSAKAGKKTLNGSPLAAACKRLCMMRRCPSHHWQRFQMVHRCGAKANAAPGSALRHYEHDDGLGPHGEVGGDPLRPNNVPHPPRWRRAPGGPDRRGGVEGKCSGARTPGRPLEQMMCTASMVPTPVSVAPQRPGHFPPLLVEVWASKTVLKNVLQGKDCPFDLPRFCNEHVFHLEEGT